MMRYNSPVAFRKFFTLILLVLAGFVARAGDDDFPKVGNPPRLVNDFAGMLSPVENDELEAKLLEYERSTSTQVTVVTVKSIGAYEPAQYGAELFNRWGLGQKGKDNGVIIIASKDDRKINITTGYGLEGALTDATCGQIIRNEMTPSFRDGNYYGGFVKASDAIIAATKGEYTADRKPDQGKKHGIPTGIIILIVFGILWVLSRRGGGGGGGSYMSRRGNRDLIAGAILGNLLGGGGRSSGWGGGDSGGWGGGSGGGFGGFGGGSSGGGGASGSW